MQGITCLLSLLSCQEGESLSPTDEYGLLKEIEKEYRNLVVTGSKTYERFVDDSVNGLSFVSIDPKNVSASVCNGITTAYGRVATLLTTRKDLIKALYESLGVSPKSVEKVLSIFDAGKKLPPKKPPLQLSDIQIYRLAQLVRRLGFFSADIDGGTFVNLLMGTLESPVQMRYGMIKGLTAMLTVLAEHKLLRGYWKHRITANGKILSSNGKVVPSSHFSQALQDINWTPRKRAWVQAIIGETEEIINKG